MPVGGLQEHVEQEQEGEVTLQLIGYRYVGERSSIGPGGALQTRGQLPRTAPLNNGFWYFARVADEGCTYLESRQDLEVVYAQDAERFAELLLEKNRLPEDIFGRGADRDLQEEVYELLGLDDGRPVEPQLYELAGVEPED